MSSPLKQDIAKFGGDMLRYITKVDELDDPEDILNGLHDVSTQHQVNVLGAALYPLRWGDWESLEKGKTVYLHKTAPAGWWEEHVALSRIHPGPGFMFAQLSIAPFTMSELMRMVEPLAIDRWPFDLALKYGMRDRLTCPVGGRWVFSYWSRNVLSDRLSEEARAILFMGGIFAAIQLQRILGPQVCRIGNTVSLTPRELAVLRFLSVGHQLKDIAKLLELGEETVRSHLKKAQTKLGVRARTHAVAQAIRGHLIP